MSRDAHFIGIDFGTTNSKVAWYNTKTSQAEILKNAEGEEKTPSVVYFNEDEMLVGKPAESKLADAGELEGVIIKSIKRNLINPPIIPITVHKRIKPVDVVAHILSKLKRDVEELHFREEVTRTVITCPAVFNTLQKDRIKEAAHVVGFKDVELLDEPVAAALAYGQTGQKVGQGILVYDLGGGTFDLAFVVREEDGTCRVGMETTGDPQCGGDDFDLALYNHLDDLVRQKLGRAISLTPGEVDLHVLHLCRQRKENLSSSKQETFSTLLPGGTTFKESMKRADFERLIAGKLEETVRKTTTMLQRAQERGYEVDTLVLIGGSSRVPLVQEMLKSALPLAPLRWKDQDVAVALGAAYHAHILWNKPVDSSPVEPIPAFAFCRKCGEQLVPGFKSCKKCGTAVVSTSGATDTQGAELKHTITTDTAKEAQFAFCRKCGEQWVPGAKFCKKCGGKLA